MPKYRIEITETLQRVIEIEAGNPDDAIGQSRDKYHNQEIVLDYVDYCDTEFAVVK
ncbi:MAG: DpnD/PcfM family protein [Phycisphaerae bacterium]|nr:DpnD/PcfM family protein [Phycisphaerae bacterium]